MAQIGQSVMHLLLDRNIIWVLGGVKKVGELKEELCSDDLARDVLNHERDQCRITARTLWNAACTQGDKTGESIRTKINRRMCVCV